MILDTGKTFVGVQIVKALLANVPTTSTRHRVLCLCYTNHALDDFLSSLIEDGVRKTDIVRLGSSPKINVELQGCCVNELDEIKFNRTQTRRFASLKKEQEDARTQIKDAKNKLSHKTWGRKWWKTASEFLQDDTDTNKMSAYRQLLTRVGTGGAKVVGKKGKSVGDDYLWRAWLSNQTSIQPSMFRYPNALPGAHDIWTLSKDERHALKTQWEDESIRPVYDALKDAMLKHDEATQAIRELRDENKAEVVKHKLVIGCTTTCAAKSHELIAMIEPSVILIEEAAEILEANVLASLSQSVKHVVMIGDHKQLRPKLECYRLRTESRGGVDFDKSLFERLVTSANFPVTTLNVQHRMRPEISALIRKTTYPSLRDAETTLNRDPIRGIQSRSNVMFIDHRHLESGDSEMQVFGTSSKVNVHEVEMAVAIMKYFLQQGYSVDDMVLLTPYLGQLVQIQSALKRESMGADINDLDRGEIKRSTGEEVDKPAQKVKTVRVATIDNFQGEEAKIVIISIVRSNRDGEIGFVSGQERVNVMLSRARDGMVIIGNKETLTSARSPKGRELWTQIIQYMEERGQVYPSFPAMCSNHKTRPPRALVNAAMFAECCPDGGCCLPCGAVLPNCPVGHLCLKKCHDVERCPDEHERMACKTKVDDKCPEGHKLTRECWNTKLPLCHEKVLVKCSAGHVSARVCHNRKPAACKKCEQIEKENKLRDQQQMEDELARSEERDRAEEEYMKIADEIAAKKRELSSHAEVQRINHEAALAKVELSALEKRKSLHTQQSIEVVDYVFAEERTGGSKKDSSTQLKGKGKLDSKAEWKYATDCEMAEVESKLNTTSVSGCVSAAHHDASSSHTFTERKKATVQRNITNQLVAADNSGDVWDIEVPSLLKVAGRDQWTELFSRTKELLTRSDSIGLYGHVMLESLHILARAQLEGKAQHDRMEAVFQSFKTLRKDDFSSSQKWSFSECIIEYCYFCNFKLDRKYPNTTRKHAENFLEVTQLFPAAIPSQWIEVAQACLAGVDVTSQPIGRDLKKVSSSSARDASAQWKRCKKMWVEQEKDNNKDSEAESPSPAVDQIMKMTGLESVKQSIVDDYNRIVLSKKQGLDHASSYNAIYKGNPGTGKTTVARLYSKFLIEVGILPEDSIVKETTGSKMITDGVLGLTSMLEEVKEAGGGVIFVDEAYQLNPKTDSAGAQVLNFLLTHAERLTGEYGAVVWIFAGYAKDMETLFEHNPGLPSRFPTTYTFDDYTFDEMLSIMQGIMARGGQEVVLEPKANKKKTGAKKENSSLNMPAAAPNMYADYGYLAMKRDETDEWGNVWKWNNRLCTFEDEFGNVTGIGASNLGTRHNPLISSSTKTSASTMWIFDRLSKKWQDINNPNNTRTSYPGKPVPKPKPIVRTFEVSNEKWLRVAVRRLEWQRGRVGFGNARAVRILFDLTRKRQAERITKLQYMGIQSDLFCFERDDLLGPRADMQAVENSAAWRELHQMEGLSEVKDAVRQLLELVSQNADREDDERPMHKVTLNRIFLGNPGTG